MKKVKNITKVLEGQKEVAIRVTYNDGVVETYNVLNGMTANDVLSENIRNGNINLKGYDTNKRILVEQTAGINTEDSREVVKAAKKIRQAEEDARKSEERLNKQYSDIANFRVNMNGFNNENNNPLNKVVSADVPRTQEEKQPKKTRYGLVIFGTAILTGVLLWGGHKLANKNCASADIFRVAPTSISAMEPATEEIKEVENSKLSEKDVKKLATVACNSKYVAKCNYTQADLENVICLVNGLEMINNDCRVNDPYRVEQFFNDMTSEAIENFFETGKINPYNYSVLYQEDSVECRALRNVEDGFAAVNNEEDAKQYFAKCYRVAQALDVDGINVLQDTNEQFEGPFYYAVADRQMIYNMAIGKSLTIPAGYIWFDLGDDYKNVSYDTQELYQRTDDYTGVMEGLRLDFIENELSKCADEAKVLSK